MAIKYAIRSLVEKITGRKCIRCDYEKGGYCTAPGIMYSRCYNSIGKPCFKRRENKSADVLTPGEKQEVERIVEEIMADMRAAELTPEEEYQMKKIKAELQRAEDAARESGLLTED